MGSSCFKKFWPILKPRQKLDPVWIFFLQRHSMFQGFTQASFSVLFAFLSLCYRHPAAALKALWGWEASPNCRCPPVGHFLKPSVFQVLEAVLCRGNLCCPAAGDGEHPHLQSDPSQTPCDFSQAVKYRILSLKGRSF